MPVAVKMEFVPIVRPHTGYNAALALYGTTVCAQM